MKSKASMMKTEWKVVDVNPDLLESSEFDDFGGIEELTDYNIIKEGQKPINIKKRKKNKKHEPGKKKAKVSESEEESLGCQQSEEIDMSAWLNCYVPDIVLEALKDLKFTAPTAIQKLVLPAAIRDHKDILGAAETGSGKTLAFGIPMISGILATKERLKEKGEVESLKRLYSLVITPTRELAIQVKRHIQAICKYTDIVVAIVMGGMAPEKQKRLLKKKPEIVVATPGRLWELIDEGEPHLSQIPFVKHLVIDEADRMLEKGHFAELTQILNLLNSNQNSKRQNLIFSATLTMIHDTPQRHLYKKNKEKLKEKFKLESLMRAIQMKKDATVVDITKKTAVVESLTESQIMCSTEEKDSYLYYFLNAYPGRTLVFCNSIDCVRRLKTVLEYLQCNPLPLHASMHQKQRLKNLERFASSETAVLLATDVAARGLDIRGIEHVIHYQVPRTAETYVHRSGRTARAQNEGLSLILIDPQEGGFYKKICRTLKKDKPLPIFPVDMNTFKVVKQRVSLVRTIDKQEHRMKRLTAQNRWFVNAAKEVEVDIEDENLLNDLGDAHETASKNKEIKMLKKKLAAMLRRPVIPKSLTGSYPTKMGKLLCPPKLGVEKATKAVRKNQKKLL